MLSSVSSCSPAASSVHACNTRRNHNAASPEPCPFLLLVKLSMKITRVSGFYPNYRAVNDVPSSLRQYAYNRGRLLPHSSRRVVSQYPVLSSLLSVSTPCMPGACKTIKAINPLVFVVCLMVLRAAKEERGALAFFGPGFDGFVHPILAMRYDVVGT